MDPVLRKYCLLDVYSPNLLIYEPVSVKTGHNDIKIKFYNLHHWKIIDFLNVSSKFENISIIRYKDMGF